MKQTLDDVCQLLVTFQKTAKNPSFVMPSECYRPMVRYHSYSVRLSAKLEDLCFDPNHQRLMDQADISGKNIYPMSLIRGDVEQFQKIITSVGLMESASYPNNTGVSVPLRHIFGLFAVMDASQIMTDKMLCIFRNTDYLTVFKEEKAAGRTYKGPSTLSEFITLRWSTPFIENRLKTQMGFARTSPSWTKSISAYLAS